MYCGISIPLRMSQNVNKNGWMEDLFPLKDSLFHKIMKVNHSYIFSFVGNDEL